MSDDVEGLTFYKGKWVNAPLEIEAIRKEVREAKAYWIKAHEMFQEELDDLDKTQQVIIESLRIYGNVLDSLKKRVNDA